MARLAGADAPAVGCAQGRRPPHDGSGASGCADGLCRGKTSKTPVPLAGSCACVQGEAGSFSWRGPKRWAGTMRSDVVAAQGAPLRNEAPRFSPLLCPCACSCHRDFAAQGLAVAPNRSLACGSRAANSHCATGSRSSKQGPCATRGQMDESMRDDCGLTMAHDEPASAGALSRLRTGGQCHALPCGCPGA